MIFKLINEIEREKAINYIAFLDISKIYHIKITQKREKRSIDQNALYWLWLTCIEQETGHDKNELHDIFRAKFLDYERIGILDFSYDRLKSTTSLNTLQFKQYLDKIQIFANSELYIELPNPEDLKFEQFKDYYSKYL